MNERDGADGEGADASGGDGDDAGFADAPEGLMEATYRALTEYGYAGLTTKKIADEWGKSQPLVHYYYETKEELIVAFLWHLRRSEREWREERLGGDPVDDLVTLVETVVRDIPYDEEHAAFHGTVVELYGEARHRPAYREQLRAFEAEWREALARILADGVETGVFRDVDPERMAAFLQSLLTGTILQKVALGAEGVDDAVYGVFESVVLPALLAGEAEE
jgi:AcrR family transcriptional regulator